MKGLMLRTTLQESECFTAVHTGGGSSMVIADADLVGQPLRRSSSSASATSIDGRVRVPSLTGRRVWQRPLVLRRTGRA